MIGFSKPETTKSDSMEKYQQTPSPTTDGTSVIPSPTPSKLNTTTNTTTGSKVDLVSEGIDGPPEEEREGFGNGVEFVLTCLGLAVGLGNIWRFPMRAFENGGSAFLIPYLSCAFLFGFPAVYFEFLTGQYNGKSPPVIFRRVMPFLEGVGWMGVFVAALVAIYYIVIVSWISIYIVNIFRGDFNIWNKCDNPWNQMETCIDMLRQKECRVDHPPGWENATAKMIPEKMFFINGTCMDAKKFDGIEMLSATEQYFTRHIIDPSTGLYDFSGINLPILAAMTICWVLTALGILKGAKIMGKISYVSVLLPYFIVVVLFVRGVTLPGASDGLYYYFGKPDYSKIFLTRTWTEALKQLCFSLSVGHGGLISLSSYSRKNNNVFKDALIVIIGDTVMSLVGGAAVFSTLGFLANQRGVQVPEVVKSGFSLAFVVYPEAMTQMPLPWLWSFLFFLMLFLLGASTEIALVDVFCSCIYDQSPKYRKKKWVVVTVWCFLLYCIGLVFSTNAGLYWFEMFDEYAAGFSSVCAVVGELLVMMYVYGFRNVRNDITEMLGEPKNKCTKAIGPHSWYFTANWMGIAPVIAAFLVALSFLRDYPYNGDANKYPIVFDILGWFVSFLPVLMIPLFMVINYIRCRQRGNTVKSLFMLQKQHVSYRRIAKNFDADRQAQQAQLPDKEPWDEDSDEESRKGASGDVEVATIDVSSSTHQTY
ncbi:hypothetical protein B9Z55_006052 [Caenorhabditis nigoni]|uniref:Transporter n=1 Tax=Caenorhabditis nigoni TaxID=1611254 RepID=A0A2G5V3X1_9PELO|nr:hypothetical protein B9Z55_006052 [Caenorhabditis nigoni]